MPRSSDVRYTKQRMRRLSAARRSNEKISPNTQYKCQISPRMPAVGQSRRSDRLPSTSTLCRILLQKSKVAPVRIFGETLKREAIDDSDNLSRAAEVAHEFCVGRGGPSDFYMKNAFAASELSTLSANNFCNTICLTADMALPFVIRRGICPLSAPKADPASVDLNHRRNHHVGINVGSRSDQVSALIQPHLRNIFRPLHQARPHPFSNASSSHVPNPGEATPGYKASR
jgi:hypothetical protein